MDSLSALFKPNITAAKAVLKMLDEGRCTSPECNNNHSYVVGMDTMIILSILLEASVFIYLPPQWENSVWQLWQHKWCNDASVLVGHRHLEVVEPLAVGHLGGTAHETLKSNEYVQWIVKDRSWWWFILFACREGVWSVPQMAVVLKMWLGLFVCCFPFTCHNIVSLAAYFTEGDATCSASCPHSSVPRHPSDLVSRGPFLHCCHGDSGCNAGMLRLLPVQFPDGYRGLP